MEQNWKMNILFSRDEFFFAMQKYNRTLLDALMQDADLVITDGEGIACILQYDGNTSAPLIIGMTEDEEEEKLFWEAAIQHGVYYSLYPPLARVIYMNLNVGEEICPELYQSVAEELSKARKCSERNKHCWKRGHK